MTNPTELQSVRELIESVGGKPNARYYRAMKSSRQLENINSLPIKQVEGTDYKVVLTNGKEIKVFVPKGDNVFRIVTEAGYEAQSAMKA